ncbi:alpha-2-macroglobulin-like protein 1 isoform 2-T2 [Discoglossus pictus]
MLPHVLYGGLLLLQLSGTIQAKLHYAVIVPSQIRSSYSELACIHLEGADGPGRVQLTLHLEEKDIPLIERNFQQNPFFICTPFQVPPISTSHDQTATIDVYIESPGEKINGSSQVLVKRERVRTVIQTDKAVYKPGQTVKFRVLSLKENLQPKNDPFPVIELQDPQKNRIGQWLDVTPQQGIADLSLPLSSEPPLGQYSIKVQDVVHSFSVEEYVLPRFEVTLKFPKKVLYSSEHVPVTICGRYTYGKPVQGTCTCKVCRKRFIYYWWRHAEDQPKDLCFSFSGKLDTSGCFTLEVESDNFNLTRTRHHNQLDGEASITEEGTGIQISTSSTVGITDVITRVSFVEADNVYRPGLPYTGMVRVVDGSDSPLPNKLVYLIGKNKNNEEIINQTMVTDENGQAYFELDNTTNWIEDVTLRATTSLESHRYISDFYVPKYHEGHLTLSQFHSQSKSFLKVHSLQTTLPCDGEHEVKVDYIIQHNQLEKEAEHVTLHYLVVSKARIQDSGSIQIPIKTDKDALHGEVSLRVHLSASVSPMFHVLSYIFLPNEEIVADSEKFKVLRCFKNKVSVGFSPDEALPGSDVSLRVQAAAGSLCALRVVDQSVVLMKPEAELTADKVHNLFVSNEFGGYDYRIRSSDFDQCPPGYFRSRFGFYPGRFLQMEVEKLDDVYNLFRGVSLKIITSSDIRKPVDCKPYFLHEGPIAQPGIMLYGLPGPVGAAFPNSRNTALANTIPAVSEKKEKIRAYFPETWIWDLQAVGTSGHTDLPVKVPDTITDWNGGAFCMGPSGFGISSPTSLRAFQPFFVDLALPYSVIRGETFTVKASVFNYLKESIKVQISLLPSPELEEEPCGHCQYQSCLSAEESKTFYWNLTATKLGELNITVRTEALDTLDLCNNEEPFVPKLGSVDIVKKPLLVQPGGVLEEKSHSSLLCSQGGKDSNSEVISLKIPENILKDSERGHVTVLGDLMGTAMQNLDRLLAMPYGCGEQNMVLFAPNIFIMQYLERTGQLNSEIQSKATKFLESGYQRQLTYKHDDGSYSAFGKRDPEGNTWLSAFTVKSFSKARPYIFIDETHLNDTFSWLKKNRHENGCFQSVGKLFNNAMKGGVDDEVSLSAYVTISLLETGLYLEDPVVKDAVSCLRKAAPDVTSVYTEALLAYVFTLCGETDLREDMLSRLQKKAVRSDGQLHWERQSVASQSDLPYWYRAPSAEVEITAYVLMSHLSGPTKDLGMSSEIVNWLSKQQNPYGGFSSTQDTVVALQALAKYAEATFSDKGEMSVTVKSKTGFLEQFHVDTNNRLLLQRATLPDIPGEYTVTATGSGCVYVQTVLRYNIPPPRSDETFVLRVETDPKECPVIPPKSFQIHISARYIGSRVKTNMALIEVKMWSGFIPVKSSVRELEKAKLIQRSEIKTDMVTLYLNEVGPSPCEISFTVEQESLVKNIKPGTVKVYDYYEPDDFAVAENVFPCNSDEKDNSR